MINTEKSLWGVLIKFVLYCQYCILNYRKLCFVYLHRIRSSFASPRIHLIAMIRKKEKNPRRVKPKRRVTPKRISFALTKGQRSKRQLLSLSRRSITVDTPVCLNEFNPGEKIKV